MYHHRLSRPYASYRSIYIEYTKGEHNHGGDGWEIGTCLWSPSKTRSGGDRYSLMREPQPGDLVIHLLHQKWPDGITDTRLFGTSFVASPYKEVNEEPPSPGDWAGMSPYYRIDLRDFEELKEPLPIRILYEHYADEIRAELIEDRPRFHPFTTYRDSIRFNQGIYLSRCTARLYNIFQRALGLELSRAKLEYNQPNPHEEYVESLRRSREGYFFARNAKLARDAKRLYGLKCQVCGFDFYETYGDLGKGYIECHHINPLSERPEREWTSELRTKIQDVAVLCANCHRMIHRKKPALSIDELRAIINKVKTRPKGYANPHDGRGTLPSS